MSRRARRRRATRVGGGARGIWKWVCRVVVVLVILVIFAGFGVYVWLRSYLQSDDFRVFAGDRVGAVMGADAQFELFAWQGMHFRTAGFSAENGGVIRRIRADGLRGDIRLAGVRRGVWEIPDVRLESLDAVVDATHADRAGDGAGDPVSYAGPGAGKGIEPVSDGLLPDRAELSLVDIERLSLSLRTARGDFKVTDVAMNIVVGKANEAHEVSLTGGMIDAPWLDFPLELQSARGRYRDGHIYLTESSSRVCEHGLLSLKGEVDGGNYAFYGELTEVRAEELVPEDWQKRITGDLRGRFKVRSTGRDPLTRGELELFQGVLTALPVLDRIAAYADTQRFRRLNLSDARLEFCQEEGRLDLSNIVIASEGLIRVLGSLTVMDGNLDGRFRVGIVPGILAHIPGAETKVFLRGEKGLLWAPLRVTGTLDHPREDLSERMIAAAGERMFEMVPETGEIVLKFAHDTVTGLPRTAVDTGSEILGEGADVIEQGAGIIREGVGGVLDLIPGSSAADDE